MMPLVLLLTAWSSQAATIDMTKPYLMMKQVSEQTFQRLKADQTKIHQDPNYLKTVVKQELMPYVNVEYAALKVLGPNLRGAKKSDVYAFIDAFRGYLVTSYAQVLTQYSGQKIQFGPKPVIRPNDRITAVHVEIVESPDPNIKLIFKLRKSKSGQWKAFDIIAEGISLLSSKQSEWNGKIRKDGILAVARELETLSSQSVVIKAKS
jgi:phospholipid transport system substrate-binding protein